MKGVVILMIACSLVAATNCFQMSPVRGVRLAKASALFSEPAEPSIPNSKAGSEGAQDKKPMSLVPVNAESISSAAGVSSAVFGFFVGGPLFALIFGTVGAYASKKENDVGDAFRGVGKAIVESYNYVTKLDNKYDVTGKASASFNNALDSTDSEVADSVRGTISKVDEFNKEYDITGKAFNAAGAATTLSEAAYEKIEELNSKYDFVETAKKAAATAADKAKDLQNR